MARARRMAAAKTAPAPSAGQELAALSDRLKQIGDGSGEAKVSRAPAASRATPRPPPIPRKGRKQANDKPADEMGFFGEADEDGLRMIAALETMESLEPDCADILIAEAAVLIVERSAPVVEDEYASDIVEAPAGSLRARLRSAGEPLETKVDEYAAYRSHVEEATIEIVETAGADRASSEPVHERKQPPVRRFFKALTGGD